MAEKIKDPPGRKGRSASTLGSPNANNNNKDGHLDNTTNNESPDMNNLVNQVDKHTNVHKEDIIESAEVWLCQQCKVEIRDNKILAMECSSCEKHYCCTCISMSQTEYKAKVLERDDILWLCPQCLPLLKKNPTMSVQSETKDILKEIREEMTVQIAQLEVRMDSKFVLSLEKATNKTIKGTQQEINKSVENTMTKTWADIVAEGEPIRTRPDEGMAEIVKAVGKEGRIDQIKEEWDKEERESNLIIFKAKESDSNDSDQRKEDDLLLVTEMLSALGLEEELECKTMYRLGRFDIDKSKDGKSRPLKIVMHNKNSRDRIMRNLFKLKDAPPDTKKLSISYDLTQTEREELAKKIQEAKVKSDSSDTFVWKIRGPPWAMKTIRGKKEDQTK
jgi:hypothetical protein